MNTDQVPVPVPTPPLSLKDSLLSDLDFLLYKVNNPGALRRFILVTLRSLSGKKDRFNMDTIVDDVLTLQLKLKDEPSDELEQEKAEKIKIENKYKRMVLWPNIISAIIYLMIGVFAVWLAAINDLLSVFEKDGENKYYVVGLAGTLLFYAIKIVKGTKRTDQVKLLLARVTITFIACFILLLSLDVSDTNLFQLRDDEVVNGQKVLLFFACGYSVDLFIQMLNKVIEKISGMIDSL
ncbi:MAG: hypothetical protein AAFO69_13510 [Bacteroidota bacterium]